MKRPFWGWLIAFLGAAVTFVGGGTGRPFVVLIGLIWVVVGGWIAMLLDAQDATKQEALYRAHAARMKAAGRTWEKESGWDVSYLEALKAAYELGSIDLAEFERRVEAELRLEEKQPDPNADQSVDSRGRVFLRPPSDLLRKAYE